MGCEARAPGKRWAGRFDPWSGELGELFWSRAPPCKRATETEPNAHGSFHFAEHIDTCAKASLPARTPEAGPRPHLPPILVVTIACLHAPMISRNPTFTRRLARRRFDFMLNGPDTARMEKGPIDWHMKRSAASAASGAVTESPGNKSTALLPRR